MCLKSLPRQAVNPSQKDYAFPFPPGGAPNRSLSPSVAEDDGMFSTRASNYILMLNYSELMALYEPYVALSYVCKLFEPCPFPN
jgi:hypothetical protein